MYKLLKIVKPTPKESEDTILIDESRLPKQIKGGENLYELRVDSELAIEVRTGREFQHHAFYLSEEFDWVIGKDSEGLIVLVPLKKQKKDC